MHIVALEFTADGPELEHAEIDRMIDEVALQLEAQQQAPRISREHHVQ
jgi:hypothetical protein